MISRRSFIVGIAGAAMAAGEAVASLPDKPGIFLPLRAPKDRGLAPEAIDLKKAQRGIEAKFKVVTKGQALIPGSKVVRVGLAYRGGLSDAKQLELLIAQFYFGALKHADATSGQLLIWEEEPSIQLDAARGTVSLRAKAVMV